MGRLSGSDLAELARGTGVIARVQIRTERAEYPYRTREGTCYPVGTFTTTLAGPDIVALAEHGEILKVFECATYALGRPFVGAIDALLEAREEARWMWDRTGEVFAKLVANSLAGKLAQRSGKWKREPGRDEPGKWGQHYGVNAQGGSSVRWRWVMGQCYRWCPDEFPRGPHTAAFAYLTAYGRQKMARIRAICPARSVLQQDTDGLHLLPAGIRALSDAGMLARSGPGEMRLERTFDSAQFWGPKHYRCGTEWKLAGLGDHRVDEETLTIEYSSHAPLFNVRATVAPDKVVTVRRIVPMPSEIERGRVGEDGWIHPPRIERGRWREMD